MLENINFLHADIKNIIFKYLKCHTRDCNQIGYEKFSLLQLKENNHIYCKKCYQLALKYDRTFVFSSPWGYQGRSYLTSSTIL